MPLLWIGTSDKLVVGELLVGSLLLVVQSSAIFILSLELHLKKFPIFISFYLSTKLLIHLQIFPDCTVVQLHKSLVIDTQLITHPFTGRNHIDWYRFRHVSFISFTKLLIQRQILPNCACSTYMALLLVIDTQLDAKNDLNLWINCALYIYGVPALSAWPSFWSVAKFYLLSQYPHKCHPFIEMTIIFCSNAVWREVTFILGPTLRG